MKCIIGHEIRTDRGFRVFEAGVDYPDEDVGDRAKYFEADQPPPIIAEKKSEDEAEEIIQECEDVLAEG